MVREKDGTLLGATIVAARAGEMIHEWIVVLEHGVKVGDLASDIHVYPTYATAYAGRCCGSHATPAERHIWTGYPRIGPPTWIDAMTPRRGTEYDEL